MMYSKLKIAPVAAAAILALSITTAHAAEDAAAADPAATEQTAEQEAPAAEAAEPAAETAAPADESAAPADAAGTEAAAPAAEAPAAEEAAPADAAQVPAAPASQFSAADLAIGTPVVASDGVQIGEVNRVTSDASGKVSEIHVTAGGPAGLGAKVVAIPANMIAAGGKPVKVSISAAEAKKLPILDDGKS
ncbi:MAG TPA: PRC-barrel domain-containing protein [Hyphomicrobium sp.]|nr:PRC-barrel domain-containing protein [Hyphomicrobium sp.]